MNAAKNFTLALSELQFVGSNLARPESVLTTKEGTLWVSDARGGVTRIDPDGQQTLIGNVHGEPNGLAMDHEGNIYFANIDDGKVYRLRPGGSTDVVLSEIDGQPLGAVNFVFLDSQERMWITVSTRVIPWFPAAASPRPDGYIILIDEKGPRIVADGILFTNEARLDAKEEYLYVAETMGARMLRYKVQPNGDLGEKEVFGPDSLGMGAFVDGFAFDAEGNIWVTAITRNGVILITPDGDAHTVFEDVNQAALDNAAVKVAASALTPSELMACVGPTLQFPTSVAFGGPDLRTVYIGSLGMPHLVTFRSPTPGLPLYHWR